MIQQSWYVGQTRAGLGPWAEKNLAAQGYRNYAPRILDETGEPGEPGGNLFSRYLFVLSPDDERHHSRINSTRGMQKLLPLFVEDPLPLRDGYVDDLMARVGLMGRLEVAEEITYDYLKDDTIDVTAGPYAGKTGTFEYRKRGLAMLMMRMLGAPRLVPVPLSCTSRAPLVSEGVAC